MRSDNIAREDVMSLRGYQAGDQEPDTIRLNANEAPCSHALGTDALSLNRYPAVHPVSLQREMADLFGVAKENLLVTRGSSEAIDVLIRAYCRAYRDSLLTSPPTFEMYRFYADVQGAKTINVPLLRKNNFSLDASEVMAACRPDTKLVFICSPNNPTGSVVSGDDILRIAQNRHGKSIIVVDEAYIEFAARDSMANMVLDFENLVVLRTLSKALALAGARCGAAIAHAATVDVLRRVLPPYSFPTPVIECVQRALSDGQIEASKHFVAEIVRQRDRLFAALQDLEIVRNVWASHANFLLVEMEDAASVHRHLFENKILTRNVSGQPELDNCIRITIGTRDENDALLATLRTCRRVG